MYMEEIVCSLSLSVCLSVCLVSLRKKTKKKHRVSNGGMCEDPWIWFNDLCAERERGNGSLNVLAVGKGKESGILCYSLFLSVSLLLPLFLCFCLSVPSFLCVSVLMFV